MTNKLAVGYVRVSTSDQAESGLSLEAQAERISAYCTLHQLELWGIISDEGQSAKTLHRPGAEQLLNRVRIGPGQHGGCDVVVVAKLDRITRSVRDLSDLLELFQQTGVQFASVAESLDTSSATGRLLVNILGTIAQWEREVIGERTKEALRIKRKNGERNSRHAPFGYQHVAGKLVPDQRQHLALGIILGMRDMGHSLRNIQTHLQLCGHSVSIQCISDLLKRNP